MTYFLMVYDKLCGDLTDMISFQDSREALAARFARERVLADDERDRIEIVVLAAESEDELRKTHARYFRNAVGLVDRMRHEDRVAAAKKPKRYELRRLTTR
jgi:hypothetical protein